ncbi:THAP domain-containing protein 1-like [Colias croceus]|uniref:THAP domain-containing protein 1-like n=1 Tax=Colias crocea TaxID=72248 RepID=UPI001E2801F2|nr:THAP domain-containing protein 1-like [Colias croceus]
MACVAYGCKSRSNRKSDEDRNLSFHRFPACEKLKDVWAKAIHRANWKPSKHSRLCSKHFESDCYLDGKKRKVLCRDAVPTIFENYPTYLQKESKKIARNTIIDSQRKFRHIISNLQPGLDAPSTSSSAHAPSIATESLTEPRINDTQKNKLIKIIVKQSKTSSKRLKKLKALQQKCRRLKRIILSQENVINLLHSSDSPS